MMKLYLVFNLNLEKMLMKVFVNETFEKESKLNKLLGKNSQRQNLLRKI